MAGRSTRLAEYDNLMFLHIDSILANLLGYRQNREQGRVRLISSAIIRLRLSMNEYLKEFRGSLFKADFELG